MKIAFLFDAMLYGGIERVGINYLKILKEEGHDVEVFILNTRRLSGIVAHHIPNYLQKNRLPSWETNMIDDWETKVEKIVEETEKHINYAKRFKNTDFKIKNRVDAISHATCGMAIDIDAKAIVVSSMSGMESVCSITLHEKPRLASACESFACASRGSRPS